MLAEAQSTLGSALLERTWLTSVVQVSSCFSGIGALEVAVAGLCSAVPCFNTFFGYLFLNIINGTIVNRSLYLFSFWLLESPGGLRQQCVVELAYGRPRSDYDRLRRRRQTSSRALSTEQSPGYGVLYFNILFFLSGNLDESFWFCLLRSKPRSDACLCRHSRQLPPAERRHQAVLAVAVFRGQEGDSQSVPCLQSLSLLWTAATSVRLGHEWQSLCCLVIRGKTAWSPGPDTWQR